MPTVGAQGEIPLALAGLPRPRVGFVGSITEFTNLELLASLARARPAWSFVLAFGAMVMTVRESRGLRSAEQQSQLLDASKG